MSVLLLVYLSLLGLAVGFAQACGLSSRDQEDEREAKMQTFYMLIRAVRPSTMSQVRRLEFRTGTCKYQSLLDAVTEFRATLGPSWDVYGEIVARQYFDMRIAVEAREESLLLRGEGGV